MTQLRWIALILLLAVAPLYAQTAPPVLSAEWAWQAPVAGPGELYTFGLQLRATQFSPLLQMTSAAAGEEAQAQPWWAWQIPADGKSHRIELLLDLPVGSRLGLRLAGASTALQLTGHAGTAQAEVLRLQPVAKEPAYTDNLLGGLHVAELPAPLPDGWQPAGLLDAKSREVGNTVELTLNVGGLQVSVPAELTAFQGVRQGPVLYAENRGDLAKALKIAVAQPRGSAMPAYTIPIAAHGTTVFTPALQLMRVGEWWVKYTFTVGTESASLPLKVHVKRAYPVLGLRLMPPDGQVPDAMRDLPYAQNWVLAPLVNGPEQPFLFSYDMGPSAELVKKWNPPLVEMTFGHPGPGPVPSQPGFEQFHLEAYQKLAKETLPLGADTSAVSPSRPLTPSDLGLQPGEDFKAMFTAGLGKYVQSVAVGIQSTPNAGALLEKIDGKAPAANGFWQGFTRQYDFTALRQFLAQNGAQLPLLLDLSERTAPGSRLGTLALARLMLEGTWQGGTGTVIPSLPADAPGFAMVRELWRELAAAEPLYLPVAEDGTCSHSPTAPVTYWTFVRGNEGIVFLANNSSAPQELGAEVRGAPVQLQVLRLSPWGAPVTRQIMDLFHFSDEAVTHHQQGIYLRLAPGEVVGLSILIPGAGPGWLASLGRRPLPGANQSGSTLQVPNSDPWSAPQVKF